MKERIKPVVLYFTADGLLTDEQFAEFNSIPGAQHRNASLIDIDDPVEPCSAVAGHGIPAQYLAAFDTVQVDADSDADADATDVAVEDMNVAQLTAYLRKAGVEIPAGSKKAQLIELALAADTDAA